MMSGVISSIKKLLKKKQVNLTLRILVSVSLLWYLLSHQDFATLKDHISEFNFAYLLFGLLILVTGTVVSAFRWKAILASSKTNVDVSRLFVLYMKGYFYNNFLPTQMGGDVYKSVALGSHINDQSLSLFSVFMDRFSGLIILLVIGLFGISALFGPMYVLLAVLALIIGLALYFPVLKFTAGKIKFLHKFEEASYLLLRDKNRGFQILGLSLLVQLLSYAQSYVLFLGLGVHLPLWSVFAYMPVVSLALLIPSFNGFGTQDTVYAFLFKFAGVTEPISITVSLMIHLIRLTMSIIGGLFILGGVNKLK